MPGRLQPTLCALVATTFLVAAPAFADPPDYRSVVRGDEPEELPDDRATTTVTRREMERRLPRSAPDALRYEPGVFVQQTAHSQASAFIRGLTGQQTLMMFDGIRLNNSTYRQGPNQYFFTLDAHTIRAIEVQRGGGSTSRGSDALGGIINALPLEPTLVAQPFQADARLKLRGTSADSEIGGRFQLELAGATRGGTQWGFLGGFGARNVGQLTGPPVLNPNQQTDFGPLPAVPRYEEYNAAKTFADQGDLHTMHGTGFKEVTGDGRFVIRPSPNHQFTLAAYAYRQYDAPRTDQCPPFTAITTQCFTYEEQFRTLAYGAWVGHLGRAAADARVTVSWQEQHEQRRLDLTAANRVERGYDNVETWGVTARLRTDRFTPSRWLGMQVDYGADTYFDWVRSRLEGYYTDLPPDGDDYTAAHPHPVSRGQYLNNSSYLYGGAWAEVLGEVGARVKIRGGARVSWIHAKAPGDPESGSSPVNRSWVPVVGHAGVEVKAAEPLRVFFNYDNSFRAPNLDDMTSRQQTGTGFQFENPNLQPETGDTFEVGGRLRSKWVLADLWLFDMLLHNAMSKVIVPSEECPKDAMGNVLNNGCASSWSHVQLRNAPTFSEVRGAEAALKLYIPFYFSVRATAAYTWSEGPKVGIVGKKCGPSVEGDRVPLSRTPPFNGTAELNWVHPSGFYVGGALQWATAQDRLSLSDYCDSRIPKYGTPGFAVVSARAGYRFGKYGMVSIVGENLANSPYRFHGSSVNGAGRGVMFQMELAPFL